jgi:uncharacterized membrane protein YhaH (DUF805 family)
LTTFDERIGRQKFWLGVLCVVVAHTIVAALLMAAGLRQVDTIVGSVQVNGNAAENFTSINMTLLPWASFVLSLLSAVPMVAISIKRRHDRNFSGVDVIAFAGLMLFSQFLNTLGTPTGWFATTLGLVLTVWGLCLFILIGFLKGTTGPNQYGPDPLAAPAAA